MKKVREGYKMTELGEIPEDWEITKLNNIADIIDSLHETPQYQEEGFPMIRVADVNGKAIKAWNCFRVSNDVFLKFTRKYIPKQFDIIMSRVGSYGIVSYLKDNEKVCLGQNIVVINPKINNMYLFYCLDCLIVQKQIEKVTVGSSQKTLSLENIKNLRILVPKLMEQKKLSSILSLVDEKIEITDNLIEKTKELKKGLMQRLLTKGIGHDRFKDTEIGRIPEEWYIDSVGNITIEHKQGYYTKNDYVDDGIYLIRITDLNNPKIVFGGMPKVEIDEKTYEQFKIEDGDFLFARSGAIGTYGIYRSEYPKSIFASYIIKFRFDKSIIDNKYFGYFYESNYLLEQINSITQGSSNININANNIKSLKVCIPSLKEQQKIALILSSVDEKINQYQLKKEKLQELKKGLMQKLLTGKIRVEL